VTSVAASSAHSGSVAMVVVVVEPSEAVVVVEDPSGCVVVVVDEVVVVLVVDELEVDVLEEEEDVVELSPVVPSTVVSVIAPHSSPVGETAGAAVVVVDELDVDDELLDVTAAPAAVVVVSRSARFARLSPGASSEPASVSAVAASSVVSAGSGTSRPTDPSTFETTDCAPRGKAPAAANPDVDATTVTVATTAARIRMPRPDRRDGGAVHSRGAAIEASMCSTASSSPGSSSPTGAWWAARMRAESAA